MEFEIVALDIDGTLLDPHSKLSPKTMEVITRVQELGIKVLLATGRRIMEALAIAESLNIKEPLITHNGALVFASEEKKVIYNMAFSGEEVMPLLEHKELEGLDYFLHYQDEIYHDRKPEQSWAINYLQESKGLVKNLERREMAKKEIVHRVVVSGEDEEVIRYSEKIKNNRLGFRHVSFKSNKYNARVLEILHSQASKGMALKHLAKLWQIPAERIMAVGDDTNDLEMISWAGLGIAMGNAVPILKKAADIVCMDNSQEGLVTILEELILKRL